MLLGAHESTSGGLHEAFTRALADGAEAVQIFTKSSRMWRAKETAAGQGSCLGSRFEELRTIRDLCRSPERVAVCVDTCHVFAAGYDIATERGLASTLERFDEVLGIESIHAFHLNDSVKPLGSRVDRHEHVCKGEIGPVAFRQLVNDERFRDVPGFLEIPPEGNRPCLLRLRKPRQKGGTRAARRVARGRAAQ